MFPEWIAILGRIALEASLRATAIAAIVGVVLLLARAGSSGIRHAAWTAVLMAMLLMPVLPYVVPAIAIPAGVGDTVGPIGWAPGQGPNAVPVADRTAIEPNDARMRPGAGVTASPGAPLKPDDSTARAAGATAWWARIGRLWPIAAVVVWAAGALFLLSRLAVGWVLVRRVLRASRPWDNSGQTPGLDISGAAVLECPLVATPLTTGLVAPRIILPPAWRSWSAEKVGAVLAHELAHVRRRDPLVAVVAHVNRALFWFHPLAWWLERTLATTAEDACDDAAVRSIGARRQYAEVLLDMAEAVRRSRGRVAWQGVGVDGTGFLGQRIDRILRGEFFREVSMTRKFIVGIGCATAIILVVACRQQQPAPAPLEPDPQLAARFASDKARSAEFKAAQEMTPRQVADLEAALVRNPEDQDARGKLQVFYRFSGQKVIGWNETVVARRRHILWLIEHHPGDRATVDWRPIYPAYDPTGYAAAKKLWLVHTSKKDAPVAVLSNAAYFFEATDKPLAEQLLLRLDAMDPGGPRPRVKGDVYYSGWTSRLGELYGSAMAGMTEGTWRFGGFKTRPEETRSRFAIEARKKLEASRDLNVLLGAADVLSSGFARGNPQLDFDPVALSTSYVERAVQLDPQARRPRMLLEQRRASERNRALSEKLRRVPREQQVGIVSALPDAERIAVLPQRVDMDYMQAEYLEYVKGDTAAAKDAWAVTRKAAQNLLDLAAGRPDDPNRGVAIFAGHVAMATLAVRENDMATALGHMEAAGKAPASDRLKWGFNGLWQRLATGLLKRGERESVARFLDRYAQLNESQREQLTTAAAAIRGGRMPDFYQYQTTPR